MIIFNIRVRYCVDTVFSSLRFCRFLGQGRVDHISPVNPGIIPVLGVGARVDGFVSRWHHALLVRVDRLLEALGGGRHRLRQVQVLARVRRQVKQARSLATGAAW